ncbi:DUF2975 domain-containing protein [Jatrophihabitans fulvus]
MGRVTVLALRGVLLAAGLSTLAVQAGTIALLATVGRGDVPAPQRVQVAVGVALAVGCVQLAMVGVWRLVTRVRRGTVFSTGSFGIVESVQWALVAAAVLVLLVGCALAPGEAVPPGMVLLVGVVGLVLGGVALVVAVLRGLLAQAVDRDGEARRLRAELDAVV